MDAYAFSCDLSNIVNQNCIAHNPNFDGYPHTKLAVYDNKLWVGRYSGELFSCNSSGECTNHGDKGSAINSLKVYKIM